MAIEYSLKVQNRKDKIEPGLVLESLTAVFPFQTKPNSDILTGPGVTLTAFKLGDEYDESSFESPYPDVCIIFHIDKFEQYEQGINTMLKAIVGLMYYSNVDMRLLFNGEEVVLQRIGRKLVLNDDPEFWTQSRLSLLKPPYQIAQIPLL